MTSNSKMLIKLKARVNPANSIYLKHMKPIGLKTGSVSYGFTAVQNKKTIEKEDRKK